MEKSVQNLSNDYSVKKKSLSSARNETSSKRKPISLESQREVNSWDCSTPSDNGKTPKEMLNDWDLSSGNLQETMVEVFDVNKSLSSDDWDSETEETDPKNEAAKEVPPLFLASSLDSFNIPNTNFVSKTPPSSGAVKKQKESRKDDYLFVEDFEEHLKDNANDKLTESEKSLLALSGISSDSTGEKVRSNQSEGTPEDSTIWMIPKSERTESGKSTSKLISSSDREDIKNLKRFRGFLKKTKSLSDMQKSNIRRGTARSYRSEYLGSKKINYNTFLLCEGSNLQRKLEIESKDSKENILGCENFHRTRVFFTEFECKAMTIEKDVPGKGSSKSSSSGNANEDALPEDGVVVSDRKPDQSDNGEENNNEGSGSSGVASVDTSIDSASDSLGQRQNGDFHLMALKMKDPQRTESTSESTMKADMSESWLLFDDAGRYQEISKTEVSIMFNGRSAEAVLQGRTEHLVPTSTFKNTKSLKNLLSNFEPKESLQYISKEEDTGGDDEFKRLIDLERKVENTLFYIRPETDFRASIRIIPVNAEMIHLWKRTRDGCVLSEQIRNAQDPLIPPRFYCSTSNLSFDTDQFNLPHDSTEIVNLRLNRHSSLVGRQRNELPVENDIQVQSVATTTAQSSGITLPEFQPSQSNDFSKLLIETRVIVDTLTNNFRTLQSRLDGESNRTVALQGELNKLRLLLKTYPETGTLKSGDLQLFQTNPCSNASLLTLKASDKVDIRSESIIEEETEDLINCEAKDQSISAAGTAVAKIQVNFTAADTALSPNGQPAALRARTSKGDGAALEEENAQGSNVITVNIYTVEDGPSTVPFAENNQENYSVTQSSLRIIEKKMKRLQQENVVITRQNMELKRKLKEISLELEKYLSSSSDQDLGADEGKELDSLREQVANLQQELENLKTVAKNQEDTLTEENLLIREEFTKALSSLNDWCAMADEAFREIQTAKSRLQDIGIAVDVDLIASSIQNPKDFGKLLSGYLKQTSRCMCSVKEENLLYENALKDVRKESNEANEISGLDQVISGYSELIEQCRKGQITGETKNKVMEDYFAVIMEKASLMEEVKILKTENEMLLESQLEHYEKLKQTMIALKDRKSEIIALESSQKLSEEEKTRMAEVLRLCEEEKKQVETELLEKGRTVEDLIGELRRKDSEIRDRNERLKAAAGEINSFEKSCLLKDEMINKLKIENEELLNVDGMKNNQIEILRDEIKNLKTQHSQIEAELASTKLFLDDSQKEMRDYITHLEALVSNTQESLEKNKQKLREANQTINRLKSENDVTEKQHQCDVKLFNNTKDELESCKEKLLKTSNRLRESEDEQEKLQKKCEFLADSEKQKSEALESLVKEYKMTAEENADLRERVEIYSKDKEELLSEQKELINKYGLLSKEIQKLQEKYRSVKTECNERTDLIRYLEMMLKMNLVEYNNRIAGLEQNISQIIEKIVVYKNEMRGKHPGVDPEVKELRHQLNITSQERKELENVIDNYYSLMKHLENKVQDREKKVDELHVRLSLEQQKAVEYENEKAFRVLEEAKGAEILKIERLESQIAVAENELADCKKELQRCQTNHENEKKKLELTIVDLRSEVKRYQLRIEVMMRNLSNCNKNMNGLSMDKRNGDSDLETLKKEIQEKDKTILELDEALNKYKAEIKLKDGDLENFRKKSFYQNEELKNLQNQIAKLQDAVSATSKTTESQQRERDEMAEKLFQSIKLIMEERSARQAIESLALEKEKNYKNQLDQIKDELVLKVKECETLLGALEDKKKLVSKLQDDLKKMKAEVVTLKGQVSNHKNGKGKEQSLCSSSSLPQINSPNISEERLESCLKELKETRNLNLELRKAEGQYQAKIVHLEDEIRDARLLIKELQGDIKTEKKSKKAFKNMILAAKMEIEKCVLAKQLMSVIAERISRHLDLSEISSRELLSGFRLSDSSSSLKICT